MALGTANLNESEIWNVISGLEESISEKLNVRNRWKYSRRYCNRKF